MLFSPIGNKKNITFCSSPLVPATNAVIVLAGPPHPALACETVASTVHVASEVAASAVHVAHEAAWAIYAAHEVTAEARGRPRTGPVGPWT